MDVCIIELNFKFHTQGTFFPTIKMIIKWFIFTIAPQAMADFFFMIICNEFWLIFVSTNIHKFQK